VVVVTAVLVLLVEQADLAAVVVVANLELMQLLPQQILVRAVVAVMKELAMAMPLLVHLV
jgi:hypothetical protein